jgi:hypothetical protein
MRSAGLHGRPPRRFKRTTIPDSAAGARADLVRRDFTVDAAALNARWCGLVRRHHLHPDLEKGGCISRP